jgi:hypothetical protein
MEADSVDEIEKHFADASYCGPFDGWVSEDFLPQLAADLRAMLRSVA